MKWFGTVGKRLFACMMVPLLASCAHFGQLEMQDHPLAGKVWDVAARRFVDPAALLDRAVESRYVLLGEIHDNPEHHRIQSRVFNTLVDRGRRPALVMEQFDVDQQEKLNTLARGEQPMKEKLRGLRGLMRNTWDWRYYEPMISRTLQEKLPLIAANLSRDSLRTVAREGYGALGSGEEERLALAAAWSDARQEQMTREIIAGHCDKIPEHMIQAVTKSQRARDAVMADKLLIAKRNGAVAIVGRNHARQDLGVPQYLNVRAPEDVALSVGLVEVDAPTNPLAYAAGPLGKQHDYLWFTARPRRQSNACDSIPAQPQNGS